MTDVDVGSSALLGVCHCWNTTGMTRAELPTTLLDLNAWEGAKAKQPFSFFAEAVEGNL